MRSGLVVLGQLPVMTSCNSRQKRSAVCAQCEGNDHQCHANLTVSIVAGSTHSYQKIVLSCYFFFFWPELNSNWSFFLVMLRRLWVGRVCIVQLLQSVVLPRTPRWQLISHFTWPPDCQNHFVFFYFPAFGWKTLEGVWYGCLNSADGFSGQCFCGGWHRWRPEPLKHATSCSDSQKLSIGQRPKPVLVALIFLIHQQNLNHVLPIGSPRGGVDIALWKRCHWIWVELHTPAQIEENKNKMATVIQRNCRDLRANYDEIELLINKYDPVALCSQELRVSDDCWACLASLCLLYKCSW